MFYGIAVFIIRRVGEEMMHGGVILTKGKEPSG